MAAIGVAVETGRAGDRAGARDALERLWETIGVDGDALHRCTVAHFLADLQDSVTDELTWDQRALAAITDLSEERARRYHDSLRVRAFLPSLRLNLADAHRRAGDAAEARRHLAAAEADLDALPDDGYGAMIRSGVARARQALDAGSTAPLTP
ncbi:hypothetical protein ABT008_20705 [Micromonospora sp. NPDC002389]|uniref:hypothetical protein n=1 Tax=Micromonospora sp. NPDC002389 TaxID=3154272 RepID=UPI0033275F32